MRRSEEMLLVMLFTMRANNATMQASTGRAILEQGSSPGFRLMTGCHWGPRALDAHKHPLGGA